MADFDLAPLDPEKGEWDELALTRRDLLRVLFWVVAGTGTVGTAGAAGRFLVGDSLEAKKQVWADVGTVETLNDGSVHRVVYNVRTKDAWRDAQRRGVVFAFRQGDASFVALDATCTHLGCTVSWREQDNQFVCPCHAGIFSREGEVVSGPAPRPLERFETKVENGVLKVRT